MVKPSSTAITSPTAWQKPSAKLNAVVPSKWLTTQEHGITPTSIIRRTPNSILAFLDTSRRLNAQQLEEVYEHSYDLPLENIPSLIVQLEAQMKEAAKKMEFEEAAKFRDRIKHLRDRLVGKRANQV